MMKQSTSFAQVATNLLTVLQGYSKTIRLLLVMFLTLTVTTNAWAEDTWKLVTTISGLATGDEVVIVANGAAQALSTTQNGNNRGQASVTKNTSTNTVTWTGNAVQVLNLEAGKTPGTFAFYTGSGYLYAASSSKNYLRTETTLSANSSWNITITSTGVATIKATGTNTNNWLRYNSSSSIFSCYGSGQGDVCIYKKVTSTPSHNITATSNNDSYGTVTLEGTTITATPNAGYRVKSGVAGYTVTSGTADVTNNGDNTFSVNPSSDCTITINFEAIPKYTVTWNVNGEVYETTQVTEGSKPTFPAPPSSCDATSTTFFGWATAAWDGKINDVSAKTIYTSANEMPEVNGAVTYYAVFATKGAGGGAAFDGTSGGDFKIYALVEGEKKYLKGTGSKISPVDEAEATEYTFTKDGSVFYIQTGTTYLTYVSSTNLGTSTDPYGWNISEGTKGSWRIASEANSSRGIVYRASTYNQFGGYSTGNITADGTEYYDVEIGGGSSVSYSDYITTCTIEKSLCLIQKEVAY